MARKTSTVCGTGWCIIRTIRCRWKLNADCRSGESSRDYTTTEVFTVISAHSRFLTCWNNTWYCPTLIETIDVQVIYNQTRLNYFSQQTILVLFPAFIQDADFPQRLLPEAVTRHRLSSMSPFAKSTNSPLQTLALTVHRNPYHDITEVVTYSVVNPSPIFAQSRASQLWENRPTN